MQNSPIKHHPGVPFPKTLLSVQETASILDIPLGLILKHIQTGVLRCIRFKNFPPMLPTFIVERALNDPNFPRTVLPTSPEVIVESPAQLPTIPAGWYQARDQFRADGQHDLANAMQEAITKKESECKMKNEQD